MLSSLGWGVTRGNENSLKVGARTFGVTSLWRLLSGVRLGVCLWSQHSGGCDCKK